ncbi:MAG: 50S ribosomal protein L20, partial [Clostridium sp.]
KVLKLAKGYYGGKSKLFKTANESVIRALRNAYVGRKLKKRDFRTLWIARINAAARLNDLTYSKFMNGMKLAGIDINRKMLSEIAINDPKAFTELVEVAKKHIQG